MPNRPHLNKLIGELTALAAQADGNPKLAKELIYELGFRKKPKAKALLKELKSKGLPSENATIEKSAVKSKGGTSKRKKVPSPSTAGEKAKSRKKSTPKSKSQSGDTPVQVELPFDPPSRVTGADSAERVEGVPSPHSEATELNIGWVSRVTPRQPISAPPTKDRRDGATFVDESHWQGSIIKALDIEIRAVRKQSHESSVALTGGYLIEETADKFVYKFVTQEIPYFKDDIPIVLVAAQKELRGTVASIQGKTVFIEIEENLGPQIRNAVLKIDLSFLLDQLRERFTSLSKGSSDFDFEPSFPECLLGELPSGVLDSQALRYVRGAVGNGCSLNETQLDALQRAQGSMVSFIWGPPGTGKSQTLATIIDCFYQQGQSVLVVSNTNRALDVLFVKLCDVLRGDTGFQKGAVIRYGKIIDEKLKPYQEYLNVEDIVERLAEDLKKEKKLLEDELAELDVTRTPLQDILSIFERVDSAVKRCDSTKEKLSIFGRQLIDLKQEIHRAEEFKRKLLEDLDKSRHEGTIKRLFTGRDPAKIEKNINTALSNIEVKKNSLSDFLLAEPALIEDDNNAKGSLAQLKSDVRSYDYNETKAKLQRLDARCDPIRVGLGEIKTKLAAMAVEVKKNCVVMGATATQVYLKAKEFKCFDVVVMDEASMLQLPMVLFCAGKAKGKVVIAGDFRQLPPIVQSDNEGVDRWIAKNIFSVSAVETAVDDKVELSYLTKLNIQYRTNSTVCDMYNRLYYEGKLQSVKPVLPVLSGVFTKPVTVINTQNLYPFCNFRPNTYSRYNLMHAVLIRNLLYRWIEQEGQDENNFGVVSPYSAQADFMDRICCEMGWNVGCGTVHRFQGNEKKVIILDITDGLGVRYLSRFIRAGHIAEDGAKLLNVALSRAEDQLIIVGNLAHLESKLPATAILRDILDQALTVGSLIDGKELLPWGPDSIPSYTKDTVVEPSELVDQNGFIAALASDIQRAKNSVVIFSAFATESRIAEWGELFRVTLKRGVRIRIVTRPPDKQGSIDADNVRRGLAQLVNLGVTVDLRSSIHEKVCLVDENVVWYGSLNALSFTTRTSETMARFDSEVMARKLAELLSAGRTGDRKAMTFEQLAVDSENPACQECGSPSVLVPTAKFGAFFSCSNCNWKANVAKAFFR